MVSKRASVIQLYTLSQSYNYTLFHSHTTIHTSTVIQLYTLPQSVLSRICFHIILPWYWTCHLSTAGLGEFRIRDLNDEINKLLREKRHWEDRIKELGGPDYGVSGLSVLFFLLLYRLNPLHPNLSMYTLSTVVYKFPEVLTRRICLTIKSVLTIKSFFSWWSFPLFSWP